MKKRAFYINAAILAGGSVAMRLAGLWFRSFICARIGADGMGLYQLIFSVFMLGITACTSGIGLAVTRLVAEGRGSKECMLRCMGFALTLSLLACGALLFSSDFIAEKLIGNTSAAAPLRILAPGLPFIAACACLKGYFFAVRNTVIPVCGELLEQGVAVGASVLLLRSPLPPLNSLMLGSTISEIASFIYIALLLSVFTRRRGGLSNAKNPNIMRSILHIAAPMLFGSFLRSLLFSAENLMIPSGLRRYGAGGTAAISQYGVMQGMVMPVIFFPLSFVSSAAMLLIPEIAQAQSENNGKSIQTYAQQAFRRTLMFGFIVSAVLIAFAGELGTLLFGSAQAGKILRIMAPLAPLMYLDNMVDNMLKGLDQQMYSLKYNFSDALMRVALISAFIPVFGIKAYIVILFASEIYNASLSISRLLKVTFLKADILSWIVFPAVSGTLLYYTLTLIKKIVCRWI